MSEPQNTAIAETRSADFDAAVDGLEQRMLEEMEPVECPLRHTFTPGLYARTIHMPAGALVVSKIHKTEHPFVLHSGLVSVLIEDADGSRRVEHLEAPYMGVTKPGTRRVLYMHTPVEWSTFHPITDDEQGDLAKIEERIIEPRVLPDGSETYQRYMALLAELRMRELAEQAEDVEGV